MIAFTHHRALKPWRLQPLLANAAAASPSGLLVNDTFTGTDNTLLSDHTPDLAPAGSSWWSNSTARIKTNKIFCVGDFAEGHIDSTASDVRITFSCANSSGFSHPAYDSGIQARWATGGSHWRITIDASGKAFRIVEFDGSSYTVRASVTIPTLAVSTLYTLTAVLQGSTITAELNGANTITYALATANLTATSHGLCLLNSALDYGDDFSIEGL